MHAHAHRQDERRRIDVRAGVAHHLLLLAWQQEARERAQGGHEGDEAGGISLLLRAADGPGDRIDDNGEEEEE